MTETEERLIVKIHADAADADAADNSTEGTLDKIINHYVVNKDFYPAERNAKVFRKDGRLRADEGDVFIREFAEKGSPKNNRLDKACEVGENHNFTNETMEWLAQKAVDQGHSEVYGRAIKLLKRKHRIEQLKELLENLPK